jgi:FdhE protein
MTTPAALSDLKQRRPEWQPWLAVVEEVLRESGVAAWDAAVPETVGHGAADTPLLSGAAVALPSTPVRRLFDRLVTTAAAAGTPKMATLSALSSSSVDVVTLFTASLRLDMTGVDAAAQESGADPEALQAVVSLLAVPFLQACQRRWGPSVPESWILGGCPICGAHPAFAELRGIERDRNYRCGRCGGEWHARALQCPFCSMHDHEQLVTLVPDGDAANAAIEACRRCLGYVKTFTRLQGSRPDMVMVEDLASAALDVAALEQGYSRPQGARYPLAVTVVDARSKRRFFAWNS